MIDNETLEELYLYNNEIDDDSIDAFCEMLENKRKLRILGLEYNKIRNKAEHVMRAIMNKPIFERLYLTQNMIQPTIGEATFELLTTSFSIRELRMNHNHQMGDEAGKRIAEGLLISKSLKVCHLSDTRMGN